MKFLALGLSFISGMGTLLGGVLLLIFLKTREHSSMHSISLDPILFSKLLAVSAGVMLLLSLDLIVLESLPSLGLLATSFYTALGSLFFVIIQKFLPGEIYNKKNLKKKLNLQSNIDEKIAAVLIDSNNIETTKSKKLLRTTLVTFFAMASHNLPEGISVAFTTDADLQLGISLCIAILLHNVLEGMIVALPIFASTNSTKKVIIWTFINGLMEPFGVIMAYSLSFTLSWDPTDFNYIHKTLAAVGGVMAGITLMELIPSSLTYNKNNSFQLLSRGRYLSQLEDFDQLKVKNACEDIGYFILNLKNLSKQDWKNDKINRLNILYSIIAVGEISKTIRHDYFLSSGKDTSAFARWGYDFEDYKLLRDQICHDPLRSLNSASDCSTDFLIAEKDRGTIIGYKKSGWTFEEQLNYCLNQKHLQVLLGYTKEEIVNEY